jgi:superfamily II DNA/RNA helicase
VEHKAYLHRSGRTARAGSAGTVITLMTPDQNGDVRALMHKAGIRPTTTEVRSGHPLLAELAPGARQFPGAFTSELPDEPSRTPRRGSNQGSRSARPAAAVRSGGGQPAAGRTTSVRSGGRTRRAATRRTGHSAADFSARALTPTAPRTALG